MVSTHSRLKAAGHHDVAADGKCEGFNTQPPEGGWGILADTGGAAKSFNTQPPEGGWEIKKIALAWKEVSTHSRLKAAGSTAGFPADAAAVSTHSRLKAAGSVWFVPGLPRQVSTHSRLKAAG